MLLCGVFFAEAFIQKLSGGTRWGQFHSHSHRWDPMKFRKITGDSMENLLEIGQIQDVRLRMVVTDSTEGGMPRLDENIPALYHWIQKEGGSIQDGVHVNKTIDGWTLVSKSEVGIEKVGTTLISIPRHLCIYSSPPPSARKSDSESESRALLHATTELMNSIQPSQWRARLAIALLSERVRRNSFYYPYLANLPFEFWGFPMFFNTTEFEMIQVGKREEIGEKGKKREATPILS